MFGLLTRLIFLSLFCGGLEAGSGIDFHPTRRTGSFIVHDLRGSASTVRSPGESGNDVVEVDLDVLAISAERVRDAVFGLLNVQVPSRPSIHLILKDSEKVAKDIRIRSVHYADGWQYRMEIPRYAEKETLLRDLVEIVLLEFANRNNGRKPAEIPRWLKVGVSVHLLNSVGRELIVNAVDSGSMMRSIRRMIGADPLRESRAALVPGKSLSISDLSLPSDEQIGGDGFRVYRAAAHLLFLELARLPQGRACLASLLRELPHWWNWETAFLRGFNTHFRSMLEFEKWWFVTLVSFTGRDPTQVWPPEVCLQQLDEILLAPVHVRWAANAIPSRSHATLQQIVSEWDYSAQREALWRVIRGLTALRTYCAPELSVRFLSARTTDEIDVSGRSSVIVASVNGDLHFRVFDSRGWIAARVSESEIAPGKHQELTRFRQLVSDVTNGSKLSSRETRDVVDRVISLTGQPRPVELVPLIDAYRSCLLRYLEGRESLYDAQVTKLRPLLSLRMVIDRTVNELDDLYLKREMLRREVSPKPIAGGAQ